MGSLTIGHQEVEEQIPTSKPSLSKRFLTTKTAETFLEILEHLGSRHTYTLVKLAHAEFGTLPMVLWEKEKGLKSI